MSTLHHKVLHGRLFTRSRISLPVYPRVGKRRCFLLRSKPVIENEELLIGDCVALFSYCCYKQILAICLSPGFQGFLSPLTFVPQRFLEFTGSHILFVNLFGHDPTISILRALFAQDSR